MKKFTAILAASLAIVVLLAGCGGKSNNEGGMTIKEGKLIMATEATFPPYEYMQGSEVVGVDVDIARAIAEELGLELVVEEMDFSAALAATQTGKADFAAAGISITEERQKTMDFSVEYANSKQVILTREDTGVNSPDDLQSIAVGVQLGTVADLELSENPDDYPGIEIERYNKYTDAVTDLINGRLDAIVLDSLPAQQLKTMDEGLIICDEELFTDVYAIAVKKGNTELLDAINTALEKLIADGRVDEFTENHLS